MSRKTADGVDCGRAPAWRGALAGLCIAMLAPWLAPASAAVAQQAAERSRVTLSGQIVEEESREPIAFATVALPGLRLGTVTDAEGRFSFNRVPYGTHVVQVRQVGYVGEELEWEVVEQNPPLLVSLVRDPVALAGIEVMIDRFEQRRRAYPRSVRTFDRVQMHDAIGQNLRDFLGGRGGLTFVSCLGSAATCLWHRGRPMNPTIYVDEMPFFGGLDDLVSFYPHEIHSLEILGGGRQLRIYTVWFMDRVAARPRALIPFPIF